MESHAHDLMAYRLAQGWQGNGIKWDLELLKRLDNPLYLEQYGYKVYSQNDEDGIIQEIFRRIGTTNKIFIEFGVQDGLESNCHYLLFSSWSGLWIEASHEQVKRIESAFKSVIDNGQLKISNSFITKDNINQIISDAGFKDGMEIDLLSIDIDGNDYYVWDAINIVNPRVVVIEYKGLFPPDCEWVMPYNPDHIWDGTDNAGSALKPLEMLGRKKGYSLVGTGIAAVNAYFVRTDLTGDLFPTPATAENLFNPNRRNLIHTSLRKPIYCLVDNKNSVNKPLQVEEIVETIPMIKRIKRRIARTLTRAFHYYD